MAHYTNSMRFICLCSIVVLASSISACRRQANRATRTNKDGIDLQQAVTNNPKPEDVIFRDFEKNWRQFISTSQALALPVARPNRRIPAWAPTVLAGCVFSPDAGGQVPQVTLTWNEPPPEASNAAQQPGQQESANIRFDLALHHDAFARNYFSTALASDMLKRFNLPPNSALVKDTEAVQLTGPGLFPKLMDFRTERMQERDTNRPFLHRNLVLRDLNPGLSYAIRMSVRGKSEWDETGQFVFLTPVCPTSF